MINSKEFFKLEMNSNKIITLDKAIYFSSWKTDWNLSRILNKKLTHNIWQIQPSFTSKKWNMDEIFGLKFHLPYIIMNTYPKDFFWNPSMRKNFDTEFVVLCKNPPFYEVKNVFRKRLCAWWDFKNIFSRPLFITIFRPKMVEFYPYSILTG